MSENIQTIFNMLGVEPNEKFKIKYDGKIYDGYYIDKYLKLICDKENFITSFTTLDIITGNIEIIYTPILSDNEQKIINSLFILGYHYIGRDDDYKAEYPLYAYKISPIRSCGGCWVNNGLVDSNYIKLSNKENIFNFITAQDDKPFFIDEYVDSVNNDEKYETDKNKIEEKIIEIYYKADKKCDDLTCEECPYERCNHIMCDKAMFIDELIANNFTFLKSEE